MHHLITIGGGAAGFFGSIIAAEHGASDILIIEKSNNLLGKVKISGGGRCNVTHHCYDPKQLSKYYPRGERSLIGPFHRWGAQDTVEWFSSHGVNLKTEVDGRMFPTTDDSQTVIDCLINAASDANIQISKSNEVIAVKKLIEKNTDGARFIVKTKKGESYRSRSLLLATGGTRLASGAKIAEYLGHTLEPPVPSLFTFKIKNSLLDTLAGVSVSNTSIMVSDTRLRSLGPLLITHWGLSGPAILKLSAWGAHILARFDYQFDIVVNWLPNKDTAKVIHRLRDDWGKRQLSSRSPFEEIPKRLWVKFVQFAEIPDTLKWSQVTKNQCIRLSHLLNKCKLSVDGKSMNKEEFVTAGGVRLVDIDLKTMQSKICPGLYFAGEIMNVDGITGGFNFQNAWMSGHHAGAAVAVDI